MFTPDLRAPDDALEALLKHLPEADVDKARAGLGAAMAVMRGHSTLYAMGLPVLEDFLTDAEKVTLCQRLSAELGA